MKRKMASVMAGLVLIATPVSANDNAVFVVQAQLDAYRARDMQTFLSTFSEDAVMSYAGRSFHGKAQIREAFSLNFRPDAPTIYLVDSGLDGDRVWMQVGYTFADGSDMCCSTSTYTVSNGRIVRLDVFGPN